MPIRPSQRARYPKDWKRIADEIRDRAGNRCECLGECGRSELGYRCQAVQHQPHPSTGSRVVLTVAHLDHTPENCDPENLRAMCQACHLSYDRDHHSETARATRAAELAAQMEPML